MAIFRVIVADERDPGLATMFFDDGFRWLLGSMDKQCATDRAVLNHLKTVFLGAWASCPHAGVSPAFPGLQIT
jgi:hypothetical protein